MATQVKLYIEPEKEIRRFNLDSNASYEVLRQRVEALVGHGSFRIFWQDEEKDFVVLGSADELATAKEIITNNLLRLFIRPAGKTADKEKKVHRMVTCDGCQGEVAGTRYKCLECPDFDLCEPCQAKGDHQEHDMLAIRRPRSSDWKKFFMQGYGPRAGPGGCSRGPCGHRGGPPAGAPAGPFRGPCGMGRPPFHGRLPPFLHPFMNQQAETDQTVEMDFDLNRPMTDIMADVTKKVMGAINKARAEQPATTTPQNEAKSEQPKSEDEKKAEQEEVDAVAAAVNAIAETVTVVTDAVTEFVEELAKAESESEWTHLEAESVEGDVKKTAEKTQPQAETLEAKKQGESSKSEEKNAKDQRIEAALRAMEEMGFSSEGNILRRLLENYSGDIGRVLDSIK